MTEGFEGMLMNGERMGAHAGTTEAAVDPSTGSVIAAVARGGPEDVDGAVEAARNAFASSAWHTMAPIERGEILRRIAEAITANRTAFAATESRNAGKPIGAAFGEVDAAANTFRFYSGAVDKIHGQTIPGKADGTLMTFREPLGVVGLIVPWNFPLLILAWKVAPALAMGNTIVAKPAGVTPLTAVMLGDIAIEAGLPPGVLNVVPGPGSSVGSAIVKHPDVRKVSFTGSTDVGAGVMRDAADDIKRVSLELGGKSASIMRDEVFGPVVAIMPFADEDDAVTVASDSDYGLSGSIWTRDVGRALRVSRAFETGMISITSSSSVHIEAPFGGMKRSGVGREQGMAALDHYSEYKTVFIADN